MRGHSPQDQIYGPLSIPGYCWPIIDTDEFQRLRHILQLGAVVYVYPGTTHSRFEHSLGCAHLAYTILQHFSKVQPEIKIEEKHKKAVIIAALCHDLGHGPFSFSFEQVVRMIEPSWNHTDMSATILRHIVKKYDVKIEDEVIDAACTFMEGHQFPGYPKFLACIVKNQCCDVDVNKFDYLSRDMNRSIHTGRFAYDRLIKNCRVVDDNICWKIAEIPTMERFFFNFNDLPERVYKHKVVQAVELMLRDILESVFDVIDLEELLSDPSVFVQYDDRMMLCIEKGEFGEKAKVIAERLKNRNLYKCVGELRVRPDNVEGTKYSQKNPKSIEEDIAGFTETVSVKRELIRVMSMEFKYGLRSNKHPLLCVPFYDGEKSFYLKPDQLSCITPSQFSESAMRVFTTDHDTLEQIKSAFQKWKNDNQYF